jgi:hypothetical protein
MGVKDKSLWERIVYRYTYIGNVEREGKPYKKYEKAPRFKNLKNFLSVVFILLLILLISILVMQLTRIGSERTYN